MFDAEESKQVCVSSETGLFETMTDQGTAFWQNEELRRKKESRHFRSIIKVQQTRLDIVAYHFNPRIEEAETGWALWVWGQPCLHSKLLNSQGYTEKPWTEKPKRKKQTNQERYNISKYLETYQSTSKSNVHAPKQECLFLFVMDQINIPQILSTIYMYIFTNDE